MGKVCKWWLKALDDLKISSRNAEDAQRRKHVKNILIQLQVSSFFFTLDERLNILNIKGNVFDTFCWEKVREQTAGEILIRRINYARVFVTS